MNTTSLVKSEAHKMPPQRVASDLLGTIKLIENAIETSSDNVEEVKGRGFFKKIFSSTTKDLINVSTSQNKINELMLGLIQEIITLNMMSYSYLASVIIEFEKMAKQGWKDSDGNIQKLSENGTVFATTCHEIFVKIIEGSKGTHQQIEFNRDKIEFNSKSIAEIRGFLQEKSSIDEHQSNEIADMKDRLADKKALDKKQSHQIAELTEGIKEKDKLDYEQSAEINELKIQLQTQEKINGTHSQQIEKTIKDLQEKEAQDGVRDSAIATIRETSDDLHQKLGDHTTITAELRDVTNNHSNEVADLKKILQEKSTRIEDQARQLESARILLDKHEYINHEHSQGIDELIAKLQTNEEARREHGSSILNLKELQNDIQSATETLQARCRILTLTSAGLFAATAALALTLGLIILGGS